MDGNQSLDNVQVSDGVEYMSMSGLWVALDQQPESRSGDP